MPSTTRSALVLALLIAALPTPVAAQQGQSRTSTAVMALEFEPTSHATGTPWTHVARGADYSVLVAPGEVSLLVHCAGARPVGISLRGARRTTPEAEFRAPGVTHRLLGPDPSAWQLDVPRHRRLRYRSAWPGVDAVLHGSGQHLQYDFELAAGADATQIELRITGARLEFDGDSLRITTPNGTFLQPPPIAFQPTDDADRPVDVDYEQRGENCFGFRLGDTDPDLPLVIDPVLGFTSWLGGSFKDEIYDIAVDPSGFVYIVGETFSVDFPTASPLQGSLLGTADAFVTKIDPTGTTVVWSTYLGGATGGPQPGRDAAMAVAVDASGEPVVVGSTDATDFPVTANAAQQSSGGFRDLFVGRLAPNGAGLVFATYLGGSSYEPTGTGGSDTPRRCDVALDASGNAIVASLTASADVPTRNAFQRTIAGAADVLAAAYSRAGIRLTTTYFGGSERETSVHVEVSPSDHVVLCGGTGSADLPWTPGSWSGGATRLGHVTRLAPLARSIVNCSSFPEVPVDLTVAADQDVIVCGTTMDPAFVTTRGALVARWPGDVWSTAVEGFVTRLDPALTTLRWSTFVGTQYGADHTSAVEVGADGSIHLLHRGHVPGWSGAWMQYLATLSPDGRAMSHAESFPALLQRLAADPSGSIWAAASSPPNAYVSPSPGAFQRSYGGGARDGIVARFDPTAPTNVRIGPIDGVVPPGGTLTATLALDGPAPAGGMTMTMTGVPDGVLGLPPSVTVPAGIAYASFPVAVVPDALPGTASVVATGPLGTASLSLDVRHRPAYRLSPVHPAGVHTVSPEALGEDGTIVGTATDSVGRFAFKFTDAGGFVRIPARTASAISRSGTIAGLLDPTTAYRLDPGGAVQLLFRGVTTVTGTNDAGEVVGTAGGPSGRSSGFYWSPATGMILLAPAAPLGSWAYAINEHGLVVGGRTLSPMGAVAFAWSRSGGLVDLGFLRGHDTSLAFGVNEHGAACGGGGDLHTSGSQAVLFRDGSVLGLGASPGTTYSFGFGMNDHGHVVGESPRVDAALWTESTGFVRLGGLVDPFDAQGWSFSRAVSINNRGQIAVVGSAGLTRPLSAVRLDPVAIAGYGTGCATGSGRVPVLAGEGFPWRGSRFAIVADDAPPAAPAVLLVGTAPASIPLLGTCTLLVANPIAVHVPIGGSGRMRYRVDLAMSTTPGPVFVQLAVIDPSAPSGLLAMSGGLEVRIE